MNKDNNIHLSGTLFSDIEVVDTSKGHCYTRFMISCKREHNDWKDNINCIAWDDNAKKLKDLKKDAPVELNGTLQVDVYQKDGLKNYSTKVLVQEITVKSGD